MSLGVAPKIHNDVYAAINPDNFVGALTDKVALVTGAGRGIGKAIALALANAGAHVSLLARTKSELDALAEEVQTTYKRRAVVFAVDVTDGEKMTAAFEETEKALGKISIVIANAGIVIRRPYVFSDFDADIWRHMEVNLKAPMLLMHLAAKSMRETGKGSIIAISSIGSVQKFVGLVGACVSKTALNCAVANLQLELDAEGKTGILAYAVNPGAVLTKLHETLAEHQDDMEKMKPGVEREWASTMEHVPHVPAELCAQTCVYLATGSASELRGRYIDVQNDIESVVKQAEIVRKENLYDLGIRELGA